MQQIRAILYAGRPGFPASIIVILEMNPESHWNISLALLNRNHIRTDSMHCVYVVCQHIGPSRPGTNSVWMETDF